jgi:voltage-gated potassium channel
MASLVGIWRSKAMLCEAGIGLAKYLLLATDSDAHTISITLSGRHLNSKLFNVVRSNHNETEVKLKLAGANRIVSPNTIGRQRIADLALKRGIGESNETHTS